MTDAIRQQVAARIRKRRESCGKTQGQLGAACGMAAARISDAEHGKGTLRIDTLERIAKGLDVKLVYFFRT